MTPPTITTTVSDERTQVHQGNRGGRRKTLCGVDIPQ